MSVVAAALVRSAAPRRAGGAVGRGLPELIGPAIDARARFKSVAEAGIGRDARDGLWEPAGELAVTPGWA
jgi:hypothetical protein